MSQPHARVDHVSIAVPEIDPALAFFRRHFPIEMRTDKRQGYTNEFNWCDFYLGSFVIELIEPRGSDGFVSRFLEKRGPGLHHLSLEVDRLDPLVSRLEADGVRIVDRFDADEKAKTAFISPRSAFGVLVQFWQVPELDHAERPDVVSHRLRNGEMVRLRADHVSIAVRDIGQALRFFERHFPFRLRRAPHPGQSGTFLIASFWINDYKVELIQPAPEQSGFLHRFLEKRGEGFHHISIDVDRLDAYVAQLEADGVRVVDKAEMGGGRKTAFLSPRSSHGVLIQLWQAPEFRS